MRSPMGSMDTKLTVGKPASAQLSEAVTVGTAGRGSSQLIVTLAGALSNVGSVVSSRVQVCSIVKASPHSRSIAV